MFKVVFIDQNTADKRYPNSPGNGDRFFTYGWQSQIARKFKKYNQEIKVECWKTDPFIDHVYEKDIDNVKYIVFPSIKFWRLGQYSIQLIKYLKRHLVLEPRTVFNIGSIRHLLFYSIAINLKNFPLVVQHHGESSAIHKTKINNGLKKIFYALQMPIEKICFKNVDVFFAVDKRIADYLPRSNRNIIIKFSTVGNDEEVFFPIDKKEAKMMLGWDEYKKHILYVGRLDFTKRPDILLDIYKDLKKEGRNDIELVLAGNKKDEPLYDRAVQSGSILYPIILQTELYKFLSAADVYCLPKYADNHAFAGVGTVPIEALLCGTPIVGNNLESFPEEDVQKIGFNCSNKNEMKLNILKILDNQMLFKDLRNIALKHYSWENISKRANTLYLKLLANYNLSL